MKSNTLAVVTNVKRETLLANLGKWTFLFFLFKGLAWLAFGGTLVFLGLE